MSVLWAIESRDNYGEWRVNYRTISNTEKAAWFVWEKLWEDPKICSHEQREGRHRAVKFRIERVDG